MTQMANLTGAGRYNAVAFSIGNKGYIGTGSTTLGYANDFWEWDQALNTWTQESNFGGAGRQEAFGFAIGNLGNAGLGTTWIGSGTVSDFWQYDP